MSRLGDIAKIQAGQAAPTEFGTEGYPFIRAGHLDILLNGATLNELPKVNDEVAAKNKLNLLQAGSILFAKSGMSATKNRVYVTNEKSYFVSHLASINPGEKLNGKYLAYYFRWFKPSTLIIDEAYPSIRLSEIANLKIPLLPLPEQQKIASILDAADNLRQKDQQLIEKYTALSQSLFLEMFGDPVINPHNFPSYKLSDAYINAKEGTKCGPFGSALKKFEYTEKGVPVWVMDNIQKSNFVFEKCLFITEEKYLSLNNYSTLKGDIIISRAGTVGKMCVVPDGYKQAIISTNLIRLRLDNKILLPLFFVLLMKYFATKIGRIKTGPDGSFTHMNTGVLNDLTFPFPPISLQIQFYEHIQLIEAQKLLAQASLEKSEALFNSLLQRAFKGELTA